MEKLNEKLIRFYVRFTHAFARMKERAKEERGAEAIEWIAMLMVVGAFMWIISNYINTGDGKGLLEGIFQNLFNAITTIVNGFFKKG